MDSIEQLKGKIIPILEKHRIKRAGIFGSFARNHAEKQSDIDLLVEVDADTSLLEFIAIKHQLEDVLGREVDLVEYSALKPSLRESILKEEVCLL